jgi:hypothetical protein
MPPTEMPPDQALARALTLRAVVGEGDLQRGVHRFRTGIGEEHMVEIAGQQLRHLGGELECRGMAHLEGRRVVELGDLLLHRLDDLLAAMAGIDAPEAGGGVQHLPALDGRVMHVLGGHEQARLALELPVGGKGHPKGFEVVGAGLEGARGRRHRITS